MMIKQKIRQTACLGCLGLVLVLCGCGQKGNLYLPNDTPVVVPMDALYQPAAYQPKDKPVVLFQSMAAQTTTQHFTTQHFITDNTTPRIN